MVVCLWICLWLCVCVVSIFQHEWLVGKGLVEILNI